MPRSLWNGTVGFGLVSVPVKVYTATEDRTIHFHQVHAPDGARIEQHRICSAEGREVPYSEVAKGYEVGDGEYVLLSKDEIAAAAGETAHRIDLEEFVPDADVPPEHYDKTYYLGAAEDGGDPYRLLHDALAKVQRVGIGRWTFHGREYLVAVRPRDGSLALHTMRFAVELVDPADVELAEPSRAPSEREIEMAGRLVDSLHAPFDPSGLHDEFRERLLDLIARKAKGESVQTPAPEEPDRPDDLLAALEASLERHSGRGHGGHEQGGRRRSGSGAPGGAAGSGRPRSKRSRSAH